MAWDMQCTLSPHWVKRLAHAAGQLVRLGAVYFEATPSGLRFSAFNVSQTLFGEILLPQEIFSELHVKKNVIGVVSASALDAVFKSIKRCSVRNVQLYVDDTNAVRQLQFLLQTENQTTLNLSVDLNSAQQPLSCTIDWKIRSFVVSTIPKMIHILRVLSDGKGDNLIPPRIRLVAQSNGLFLRRSDDEDDDDDDGACSNSDDVTALDCDDDLRLENSLSSGARGKAPGTLSTSASIFLPWTYFVHSSNHDKVKDRVVTFSLADLQIAVAVGAAQDFIGLTWRDVKDPIIVTVSSTLGNRNFTNEQLTSRFNPSLLTEITLNRYKRLPSMGIDFPSFFASFVIVADTPIESAADLGPIVSDPEDVDETITTVVPPQQVDVVMNSSDLNENCLDAASVEPPCSSTQKLDLPERIDRSHTQNSEVANCSSTTSKSSIRKEILGSATTEPNSLHDRHQSPEVSRSSLTESQDSRTRASITKADAQFTESSAAEHLKTAISWFSYNLCAEEDIVYDAYFKTVLKEQTTRQNTYHLLIAPWIESRQAGLTCDLDHEGSQQPPEMYFDVHDKPCDEISTKTLCTSDGRPPNAGSFHSIFGAVGSSQKKRTENIWD